MALWSSGFHEDVSEVMHDFNSSIVADSLMYAVDIEGSIAHANMLGRQGIIGTVEANEIVDALQKIKDDIDSGVLKIDKNAEDIHTFIEEELTARIGNVGKELHTARSRNGQVALDIRLYTSKRLSVLIHKTHELITELTNQAESNLNTIMPGYTHLQPAQVITYAHYLMSYVSMFLRDTERFREAKDRTEVSPLGAAALAGTPFPIDLRYTAKQLGFAKIFDNSLDAVSDRDFALDTVYALSTLMVHLSQFSAQIVIFSSQEFGFLTVSDAFTTGSSIMPQKKNVDAAELLRAKSARIFANLIAMFAILKDLPPAYNKDLQETKELLFESIDITEKSLSVFTAMIKDTLPNTDNMRNAASHGFLNATDAADYLVRKGVPFRDAYRTVSNLIRTAVQENKTLETLTIDEYKAASPLFDDDIYATIDLAASLSNRDSHGGAAPDRVKEQIQNARNRLSAI
ncbi:MAG: argininosuccinate lyase [Bifidobacteriaceae bacterium]|jgi:argininosuccinate lyase|nr:argininosuccinate lyase [Bifidobacteriaceae bacterium]